MGALKSEGASGEKQSRIRFDELVAEESEARRETTELFIPTGERLGEKVVEINNLTKAMIGCSLMTSAPSFPAAPLSALSAATAQANQLLKC